MANNSEVYGGYEWMRLQLDTLIAAAADAFRKLQERGVQTAQARSLALQYASQELARQEATGWISSQPIQPFMGYGGWSTGEGYGQWYEQDTSTGIGGGTSQEDEDASNANLELALNAIYEKREDIKKLYDNEPAWQGKSPIERMKNWITVQNEGITDPVRYALDKGWVDPADLKSVGTPRITPRVTDDPTRADALIAIYNNRRDENGQNDIKAFYDTKAEWRDRSVLDRMENWLSMTGEAAYKGKTDSDLIALARSKKWLMTSKENEAYQRSLNGQTPRAPAGNWNPLFVDEQDDLTEDMALWSIWSNDYRIRNQYGDQHPDDWRGAMEAWQKASGTEDAITYAQKKGWLPKIGEKVRSLAGQQFDWQQETDKQNAALAFAQALNSKSGPGDFMNYWGFIRDTKNTALPAWLQNSLAGHQMPAWGGYYGQTQQAPTGQQSPWLPAQTSQAAVSSAAQNAYNTMNQQTPYSVGAGGQDRTGQLNYVKQQLGQLRPWQITPLMWNNMAPSEKEGLLGGVQSIGGWGEDFKWMMEQAAPKGGVGNQSWWNV